MSILIYVLFLSSLIFVSCNDDDDCMATDLATTIVGTWEVEGSKR